MFIAFEGIDGSGKTTIAKKFAEEKGFQYTREPTFSSDEADLLNLSKMDPAEREVTFMIDRIKHQEVIKGINDIVSDRYIWSALVYSYVFSNNMYSFLKTVYMNKFFKVPDFTIIVEARLSVCRERSQRDQSDEILMNLKKAYDVFRPCMRGTVISIDNSGSLDATMDTLYNKLSRFNRDLGK